MVHKQTEMELKDRLLILETEANQHQQVLDATKAHLQSQIDKFKQENTTIQENLKKQKLLAEEAKRRADEAEAKLEKIERELGAELSAAQATITSKLQFIDTANPELNAFNIPPYKRQQQLQTKELVAQATALVKELVQGLSNFYTYTEQRTKMFSTDGGMEPLSDSNKKYCEHLHENMSYLRPMEQSMKNFQLSLTDDSMVTLETAVGLQEFSSNVKKYVTYNNKLLPYQLLSIEEECSATSCSSSLEAKNMALHTVLQKFDNCWSKVESYISIIALQSTASCDHSKASQKQVFRQLSTALADLYQTVKDLSQEFNSKISIEHQLPTMTQKLKSTDECIATSLVILVTCLGKMSAFFTGNLEFFQKCIDSSTDAHSRPHPVVGSLRQNTASYLSSISKSASESVPYHKAIENRKVLFSSTESRESLAQQVEDYSQRVSRLEQDKEHWMLESQLLQIKFEKETQKVTRLEKDIQATQSRSPSSIADNIEATPEINDIKSKLTNTLGTPDTSMLGELSSSSTHVDSEALSREQLIKDHCGKRISELTAKLQQADSKTHHFHAECRALHKRLTLSQAEQDRLTKDLDSANQVITQLKDELQTTRLSYEGQLSTMSDHLASMNEKLAKQNEEIEHYKYQLSNVKSGKKGKK